MTGNKVNIIQQGGMLVKKFYQLFNSTDKKDEMSLTLSPEEEFSRIRKTVSSIHPKKMQLKVEKVIEETSTTKTFCFSRTDAELPPFRAGQYMNLFVSIDGINTSRPYSISSSPKDETINVTVRRVGDNGFVSNYLLDNVKAGDLFESSGPAGHFYYESLTDGKTLVFLAGGSGITPFMSMVMQNEKMGRPLEIFLLYGSRVTEDMIFDSQFQEIARDNDQFHYLPVISEPSAGYGGVTGFLTQDRIMNEIKDINNKTFYLCGPNIMVDFCLTALNEMKVPRHKIKRELFGAPQDITKVAGWPSDISRDKVFNIKIDSREIQVSATEPLMNSLERNNIVTPALCRSGECSVCRTKLLKGNVFAAPGTKVRESDQKSGFIHTCGSYPISDLELKLLD